MRTAELSFHRQILVEFLEYLRYIDVVGALESFPKSKRNREHPGK